MPGTPMPFVKAQWLDENGDPYNGALLFSYLAGTTTKVNTFTDKALGTPNSNPIVLDSAGRAVVFLDPTLGSVKFVLAPSTDSDPPVAPIWTADNIAPVTFYDVSTTIGRVGTTDAWAASDNSLTLTIPHRPVVAYVDYVNAAASATVNLPAGTLASNGDQLILEWEAEYSTATVAARATMFGTNVDLGIGAASILTHAKYIVSRQTVGQVQISQQVMQANVAVATTHLAQTEITSLDLDNTAYTIVLTTDTGTDGLRGARIYLLKALADLPA